MMNAFKFNNTPILRPLSWSETSNVIESVNTSESGTDIINVVRYDKLTISCEFGCTDAWAKTFKEFSLLDSFTLTRYDVISEAEESRTVRMRNYSQSLVKDSEKITVSNGLYNITFDLEEI